MHRAQIADLALERRRQRAIFLEAPRVARQHEADIQLLERAVTTVTDTAVYITTPRLAARWAEAVELRRGATVACLIACQPESEPGVIIYSGRDALDLGDDRRRVR